MCRAVSIIDDKVLQMNLTTKQFLEILGVLSVVLSLLFVAFEIRQTNQIAMVATEIEIRNNFSELNEAMFSDPDLAVLLEKCADPDYQPLIGEYTQLRSLAFRFLNIWLAAEIAYENDMLPNATFDIVLDDIGYVLQGVPYMKKPFRDILDGYPGWADTKVVRKLEKHLARDT